MKSIELKTLFFAFVLFFSLEGSAQNFSYIIDDVNYSRVSDDNIDEIATKYVGDAKAILYLKLIKKKGQAPYFFTIFRNDSSVYFHSVHKVDNSWTTLWGNKLTREEYKYFALSGEKLEGDNSIFFLEGCLPHSCNSAGGYFIYNSEVDSGLIVIMSEDTAFHNFFPFGVPANSELQIFLQERLYGTDYYQKRLSNIISLLPQSRSVLELLHWRIDSTEPPYVIKKLMSNARLKGYELDKLFLSNFTSKKNLDYLLYLNPQTSIKDSLPRIILYSKSKADFYEITGGEKGFVSDHGLMIIKQIVSRKNERYILACFGNGGTARYSYMVFQFKLNTITNTFQFQKSYQNDGSNEAQIGTDLF